MKYVIVFIYIFANYKERYIVVSLIIREDLKH